MDWTDVAGDFTLRSVNPKGRLRRYDVQTEELAMAGKTTNEPISSTSDGPTPAGRKAGEKVTSDKPGTVGTAKAPTAQEQEQLDKAPVLDQREYIVDGNTAVPTRETEEGQPFDQEQYETDRADALGASGSTLPLDDVAIGLAEGGAGNPAAASHESGFMDVPKAEGDPDSIRAWNARKAAEAKAQGTTETAAAATTAETDTRTAQRTAASRQASADAKKRR